MTESERKANAREYSKKHYAANKEKYIAKAKQWAAENVERHREIKRESAQRRYAAGAVPSKYRGPNEKRRANARVKHAVKTGLLTRPDSCEECGGAPQRQLHGHHEDYAEPLSVEWLCEVCHKVRHTK